VFSAVKFGKQKQGKPVASKNLKELNAIVNTLQIRRESHNTLHLPPKIHTYPELELTGDHKAIYQAMKKLAVVEIEALGLSPSASIFSVQARSAVLAMLRCEQIAQGFCGGIPETIVEQLGKVLGANAKPIPGRPREVIFPSSPKMVWLTETIDGLLLRGKRPVIFSRFNAPMFWLMKHYSEINHPPEMLHGGLSSKEKDEVVHSFQKGFYTLLFVQVRMAEGFNLHNSQDCIFLGRDWSPAINKQAEGRLHRKGQVGTVNVQIPVVRGTVEAHIHKRLMTKDADAEQALRNVTIKDLLEML
jgi:SNF2 family DNA or RNA helicase